MKAQKYVAYISLTHLPQLQCMVHTPLGCLTPFAYCSNNMMRTFLVKASKDKVLRQTLEKVIPANRHIKWLEGLRSSPLWGFSLFFFMPVSPAELNTKLQRSPHCLRYKMEGSVQHFLTNWHANCKR